MSWIQFLYKGGHSKYKDVCMITFLGTFCLKTKTGDKSLNSSKLPNISNTTIMT